MEAAIGALTNTITTCFQNYLDERSETGYELSGPGSVVMGDVDVDRYRDPVNVFLIPDQETFDEDDLGGGELTTQDIAVFILIKKEPKEILSKKIIRYGEAFRKMTRENNTLLNQVGYAHTERAEYIEGVEGSDLIKGIKLTVKVTSED